MSTGLQILEKEGKKSKKNLAHYFNPIDKGSSKPAWYYSAQIDEEKEWIRRAERELKEQTIPMEKIAELKVQLKVRKDKYEEIMKSKDASEKLVNTDKDKAFKRHTELEEIIKESMFTRDEMHYRDKHGRRHRTVDPREEAERGIHRNHLIKEYTILGRLLGENTNIEALRRGR